ncbi:hypothetical protein B0H12DRAFT_1074096 [Mycena haematopus]|nr:hypothetical protein B0H12DRAFT_1074096 [Mycena haematopus]
MTELWTTIVKGQSMATFKPPRLLKLTNATLGIDNSDGRTMALLEFPRQNSIVSSFVCALTAGKDDHKLLDIVLDKDVEYRLHVKGPNDIHFLGYFLPEDIHPGVPPFKFAAPELRAAESNGDLSSAPVNLSTKSTATNTTSASVVQKKRKLAPDHDAKDLDAKPKKQRKTPDFMWKDSILGPKGGFEAVQDSTICVNLKFLLEDENKKLGVFLEEKEVQMKLDGSSKERAWKQCIIGMREHGTRWIRVPSALTSGPEGEINKDITVEVTLLSGQD